MKAILMSIKRKWGEMIFSGEKTVEVRKTAPKLKPPFKAYVYEAIGQGEGAGAVVGEFVCDKVEENIPKYHPVFEEFFYSCFECGNDCLSQKEMQKYGKDDTLRGLHITAPKRYDTPKELSEFNISCEFGVRCNNCKRRRYLLDDGLALPNGCDKTISRPPQSWMYVEEIEE